MVKKRRKYLPNHKDRNVAVDDRIAKDVISSAEALSQAMDLSVDERLDTCLSYLSPREQSSTLEWNKDHSRNTDGRPYSHSAFPHLGAPGGPSDTMDDPQIRRIWLQFASRLGKTYFGQCCAMKKADCNPGPMMLASSVEKTALEVTERTYKIIEHSPRIAWQLRAKNRRRQSCIDFDACQCVVAWSRSVSTLADKELEFGHANEIDKWEHPSTSREADPLKLFTDRFKNRPHHKILLESTPSVKNNSRVEAGRLASTNCQYFVPCPHCHRYQTLRMGKAENPRLIWEKLPNGRSDKDLARKTAHYLCEYCEERIEDHHRSIMMRQGVWCPEGCSVNDEKAAKAAKHYFDSTLPLLASGKVRTKPAWNGWKNADWIVGAPLRDGPDAGYQLSSLYALSLSWGDLAAEFVACKDRPQELRNFVNQWLAETWEHIKRQTTWEQLGVKLIIPSQPREQVPDWASLLTCGIDRQDENGSRFPYVITAWGSEDRCSIIAYGECSEIQEVKSLLIRPWPRADGTTSAIISFGLFDSGFRPDGVYEFCRNCHYTKLPIWPSKGSQYALDSDYRKSLLGENTSMPGMVLFMVDTVRSQLWIENMLDPMCHKLSLYQASLLDHQDFLEQVVNDAVVDKLDSSNNIRQTWERVDTRVPNDMRDCLRYAYIAKQIALGGRDLQERVPRQETISSKPKNAVINSGITREDGRPWL